MSEENDMDNEFVFTSLAVHNALRNDMNEALRLQFLKLNSSNTPSRNKIYDFPSKYRYDALVIDIKIIALKYFVQ